MYLVAYKYEHVMSDMIPVHPPVSPIREVLKDLYFVWCNDYLTVEKMAADYNLNPEHLKIMLDAGRDAISMDNGNV